jgi:hypothetical protein
MENECTPGLEYVENPVLLQLKLYKTKEWTKRIRQEIKLVLVAAWFKKRLVFDISGVPDSNLTLSEVRCVILFNLVNLRLA